MRVRLTDQALVAVGLARVVAEAAGHPPTVASLLAGLAAEPDGRAGRRLRERASAAVALTERAATTPAPPVDEALRAAGLAAGSRAVTTVDLLDAVVAGGGRDVADLLAAAGYDHDLDGYAGLFGVWCDDAETFGLGGGSGRLTPAAARAVAQARARDSAATDLVLAVAVAPEAEGAALAGDPSALELRLARLVDRQRQVAGRAEDPGRRHDSAREPAAVDPSRRALDWDRGVDAVLAAAETITAGRRITTADLVRAAVVAGGEGPRLLLAGAEVT